MTMPSERTEVTLTVDLDLRLDDSDIEKFNAYFDSGMSEQSSWSQVAQDLLGGMGAVVNEVSDVYKRQAAQ